MRKVLACLSMVWSLACSDATLTCTAKACLGSAGPIALVDEHGLPVVARGEVRNPEGRLRFTFDCTVSSSTSAFCQGNSVVTAGDVYSTSSAAQIRFEQGDGSFTPWQPVPFDVTSHTDPDFNGPGCSCTWYTAAAADVIVPVTARLPGASSPDAG